MVRAAHANCFLPPSVEADVVWTDEPAVAEAAADASLPVLRGEDAVNPDVAHRASVEIWKLAFSWFRHPGGDDTVVGGVSAGDLAGFEAAIGVLLPAARAALATAATLRHQPAPSTLVSVAPEATTHGARYDRLERLAADVTVATAAHLTGGALETYRLTSSDPRNGMLRDKYARTRDADVLVMRNASRAARQAALEFLNGAARLRRRSDSALLVVEYNPTLAFSRAYAAMPGRRRLVRWVGSPEEIVPAVRAGDLVLAPPMAGARLAHRGISERLAGRGEALVGAGFEVDGIPLWPLVRARLLELADRYASFAADAAPRLAHRLTRWRVGAVLVPFDYAPPVRLLVRVAQSLGIPTFTLNDGYKADDVQLEGMSTDVALAWSTAIAESYFVRSPGRTIVTGNPRLSSAVAARPASAGAMRVLVGTFTFSPSDLNCRRSDPERFLDQVLEGISAALGAVAAEVTVKLHPADEPAHYISVLARHPPLRIDLRTDGDVVDLFDRHDVYVTTYSTSLLEAARTTPTIYYRINEQRPGPPWVGDPFIRARTASTPAELAGLLHDRELLAARPPNGWVERYLGPSGANERIVAAIESALTA